MKSIVLNSIIIYVIEIVIRLTDFLIIISSICGKFFSHGYSYSAWCLSLMLAFMMSLH